MSEYSEEKSTMDKIEVIGKGTLVQHGDLNKRVYLMKLHPDDCPSIITFINNLARAYNYTKLFAKIPSWAYPAFQADGYIMEAMIPKFYQGKTDAVFASKFLNSDRLLDIETEQLIELHELLAKNDSKPQKFKLSGKKLKVKELKPDHAEILAFLFREVFQSYPFPIHDSQFLLDEMKKGTRYFGIFKGKNLVAASSAEIDEKEANAEMTDFAVDPNFRGKKLAIILLQHMEKVLKKKGIHTFYTIARLNSAAMNKTFFHLKYQYGGTLIMNTNIAGKIESMNVLYKHAGK